MTERQKKFCIEYAKTGNATQSAISAGYSARSAYAIAWENLRNVEVLNYLEELTGIELERDTTAIVELVRFYLNVFRDESVPLALRLKAADSLSKRCGFYNQDTEQEIADEVLDEIQNRDFIAKIEANAKNRIEN